MLVIDSHCDTPSQILRLRDLSLDNKRGHVDFPKLKAGGVDASFFALYTPQTYPQDSALSYVRRMIDGVHEQVGACPEMVRMAFSARDILANKASGHISILLGMENGMPIGDSLSVLDDLYGEGVRYVTLTHNGDNQIADSAAGCGTWNGLSPFGREVVARMNSLGMIIDMAHCSDKTFWDTLELSTVPVVSTHSCCRALASHRRNMTDQMIKAMADRGGCIQINFYPVFLSDAFVKVLSDSGIEDEADAAEAEFIADPSSEGKIARWHYYEDRLAELSRPGVKEVVDHIVHAVNVGGVEHVGIGSDFDGINVTPKGLENVSYMGRVFDELTRRGFSMDCVDKIAGGNFLRVFKDVEKDQNRR